MSGTPAGAVGAGVATAALTAASAAAGHPLPIARSADGLALAFYGDDFTGSTDVMESLTLAGMPTVLFLDVPSAADLQRFAHAQAIGIAGISRTMTPAEMDARLPRIFEGLRALGAPIVHYKLCSTFDSAPEIGSIGRALDLARETFGTGAVPLVVGVPPLGRYTAFGTLFATAADGQVYRLDRHPSMSRHPITPMHESDLRRHLAAQTDARIDLLDIVALRRSDADERLAGVLDDEPDAVLFDVMTDGDLALVGRLLTEYVRRRWEATGEPVLCFGSSGLEYALTAAWPALPQVEFEAPEQRVPTFAVCGSRAPRSNAQVAYALAHGMVGIELHGGGAVGAVDRAGEDGAGGASAVPAAELAAAVARAAAELDEGRDALVWVSADAVLDSEQLGRDLARLTREVVARTGVRRVVVAGGDTSGRVASELGIVALEVITPVAPGAPLCRAHSDDARVDGLEIALKGGQVGRDDYLTIVAGLGAESSSARPSRPHDSTP